MHLDPVFGLYFQVKIVMYFNIVICHVEYGMKNRGAYFEFPVVQFQFTLLFPLMSTI